MKRKERRGKKIAFGRNKKADCIVPLFKIGIGRASRWYVSRLDSDMHIEMFEDRARSGRPFEIACKDLKHNFFQFLVLKYYYVTIRSVER